MTVESFMEFYQPCLGLGDCDEILNNEDIPEFFGVFDFTTTQAMENKLRELGFKTDMIGGQIHWLLKRK